MPRNTEMATSLAETLLEWAEIQPDKVAYTFLVDGESTAVQLTYGALDWRARTIAVQLQSLGAGGKPVLLLYPPGLEFVCGFMGCMHAGAIAVPVPAAQTLQGFPRALGIARDAKPQIALTTTACLEAAKAALADLSPQPHFVAADSLSGGLAAEWRRPQTGGDDLAFLQYTSGSTGEPRGVMVSNRNVLHNLEILQECCGHTAESSGVIWLPPYHDLGLIGGILQPMYIGGSVVLMPPAAFLQRPLRWLEAISRFHVSTSGGPNFAYDLCVDRIRPQQVEGLDLSCWELAFSGAEPVRKETIDRFCERFGPCGFRREAIYSCFGLAESTLFVSGGVRQQLPVEVGVETAPLRDGRVVEGHPAGSSGTRILVSSGSALGDGKIVIVDPDRLIPAPPNRVGEIWVSGPSVARGYWNRPTETAEVFKAHLADSGEGPFLRTGDLGFLRNGDLYITGRLKDVIIVDGSNHYPQDIEFSVEKACPFLDPGSVAAFAAELDDREKLIVVAEIRQRVSSAAAGEDTNSISGRVRRAVSQHHGLSVHDVLLVRPGTIPRTSSGKIRHYLCRARYMEQSLLRLKI